MDTPERPLWLTARCQGSHWNSGERCIIMDAAWNDELKQYRCSLDIHAECG